MNIHSARCIELARQAIAENNGWTLADAETHGVAYVALTPETDAEALEWLGNGNVMCINDGEACS